MRIETTTRTVLTFNELTQEQKNKVYDKLRHINVDCEFWHEGVKDDFHTILGLLGFENIESHFSGVWSQGDGASFKAKFKLPSKNDSLKDRIQKLKDYAPNYFEDRPDLTEVYLSLNFSYELENDLDVCEVYRSGHYYHECTMYCDNDPLQEFSRTLATKYYIDLENAYEYLTSDEAIKETIQSNEYEFYSDTLTIA